MRTSLSHKMQNGGHFMHWLMYITSTKFEENNISEDILYFEICPISFGTTDDAVSFHTKTLKHISRTI